MRFSISFSNAGRYKSSSGIIMTMSHSKYAPYLNIFLTLLLYFCFESAQKYPMINKHTFPIREFICFKRGLAMKTEGTRNKRRNTGCPIHFQSFRKFTVSKYSMKLNIFEFDRIRLFHGHISSVCMCMYWITFTDMKAVCYCNPSMQAMGSKGTVHIFRLQSSSHNNGMTLFRHFSCQLGIKWVVIHVSNTFLHFIRLGLSLSFRHEMRPSDYVKRPMKAQACYVG